MSDPRPAPRYGEYATPEEQRAAIREPAPRPAPAASVPHRAPQTAPATTVAAQPTRLADRIITMILLGYGLLTVLTAIPQILDFTAFAQTWMDAVGVDGAFTNTDQGRTWGMVGAIVFGIGWLITAALSWLSLVKRRVTWWIPLVGAILTFGIVSACLLVPLLGDPAVAAHFGAA